jgi:hypothetical protein
VQETGGLALTTEESKMAKPVKHRGKWRIRWIDEHEQRRSETYDDYRDVQFKLSQYQARVEEVKRGLRAATPPHRTFEQLFAYCPWRFSKMRCMKRCCIRGAARGASTSTPGSPISSTA